MLNKTAGDSKRLTHLDVRGGSKLNCTVYLVHNAITKMFRISSIAPCAGSGDIPFHDDLCLDNYPSKVAVREAVKARLVQFKSNRDIAYTSVNVIVPIEAAKDIRKYAKRLNREHEINVLISFDNTVADLVLDTNVTFANIDKVGDKYQVYIYHTEDEVHGFWSLTLPHEYLVVMLGKVLNIELFWEDSCVTSH